MTPVGVFFICQNEDKCHFVNSTKLTRCADGKLGLLIWNRSYNANCYCINKKHKCYYTNN